MHHEDTAPCRRILRALKTSQGDGQERLEEERHPLSVWLRGWCQARLPSFPTATGATQRKMRAQEQVSSEENDC